MGLFSETKTYVASSAMHLIDAGANPMKDAVYTAVLKNEKIPETIMKSLMSGMANKVDRAHKYAKEQYYLGLPEGETLGSDPINSEELIGYIKSEIDYTHPLMILDQGTTQYTPRTAAYEYLLNVRGYDVENDIVNIWPEGLEFADIPYNYQYTNQVRYDDISKYEHKVGINAVRISADGTSIEIIYDLWVLRSFIEHTQFEGDAPYLVDKWTTQDTPYIESIPIPDGNTIWDDICLVALYQKVDAEGQILPYKHVWVYRFKDNKYPELHAQQATVPDEFMPVIPLRYNNQDYSDPSVQNNPPDPNNLYSTSKELLRRLDMDFEKLGETLNENPDIADIDRAYIMWGVDLQTEFIPALFYLTEFFDNKYYIQNTDESAFLNYLSNPDIIEEPINQYNFNRTIFDSYSEGYTKTLDEHGLALYMKYDYITSELSLGTIGTGEVGYAEKSIESYTVQVSKRVEVWEGEYETRTETQTRLKLVLKAQVLPDQFKIVSVHNLQMINRVYKNNSVLTSLSDVRDNPDDHNFIIPIQYNLASKFDIHFRNILYADSTLLVINAIEKVKLKWYETAFFRFITFVVVAVISAWTGQYWLMALSTAANVGMLTLLIFLAETLLVSVLVNMAVDWIVTEYGDKIGVVGMITVAIIATIASGGIGLGANSSSSFMMATAQYMMQGATALISSVNEFLVEEAKDIYNEYAAFTEELDGLYKELEVAQDLLENKSDIDPLMFSRPARLQIVPNESPSAFYTRCLGLPDNTMFTIHDQIPNFVKQQLKLDKNISYNMMNSYS